MKRLALGAMLLLVACSHPEDRRWSTLLPPPASGAAIAPSLSVYSFATPPDQKSTLSVRDLSAEGQAAYIALLSDVKDPAALRRAVAAPIAGPKGLGATAKPTLDRTLVIGVQKAKTAGVADRLMRTVITIVPHDGAFAFAGYSVIATDNQIQNIAHLDTKTDASLDLKLAPQIGGFGDNGVEGKIDHSKETSADISQQYEKLNVDIQSDRIVITRESERGLDVVGNTIVKLSIVPTPPAGIGAGTYVFLVGDQTLFKDGMLLKPADASLEMDTLALPLKCALQADVSMDYRARHVVKGAEYYTEGKQDVQLIDDSLSPNPQTVEMVRADDTAPQLWQIVFDNNATGLIGTKVDGSSRPLVFDNYEAAQALASWLQKTGSNKIGKDGITVSAGGRPLLNAKIHAESYSFECTNKPNTGS